MKKNVETKKIVYGLLIAITVIVLAVVAISSFFPSFTLKDNRVAIELGEEFDPLTQVSKVKNMNASAINITSEVNNQVPGEYTVYYKYFTQNKKVTVVVEDRDYPVFSIKDGQTYYMSTEFDINNVVVSITDKTGVSSFTWEAVSGGIDTPGTAELKLTAADAYGHVTVNNVTVIVVDDVAPELILKDSIGTVEAGSNFDPMTCVEKATDNAGDPVISFTVTSGALNKVGKVAVVISATDAAGNVTSAETSFDTVDTTAPVVVEKTDKHTHKMSQKLDPSQYFDISDNTEKTKVSYELISGELDKVGTIQVAVKVADNYGNTTDAGTISIEVEDDIPPEFKLTRSIYTINLGRYFDVDSIIASASDNSGGPVTFSYEVKEGTLEHAGYCVVNIIATDMYGNKSVIPAPFNIVDKVAPVVKLDTSNPYIILGEEFKMEDLVISCTDNDEVSSFTMKVVSGSLDKLGDVVLEYTAVDPSNNVTSQKITVRVKTRVYQDFGTEKHVEITGQDNQPYLIAVNRYMGVVTIYGKDENGDYTVPVKAMLCSVGINSGLEENFGVRSGDGLTPLGVYQTNGKTNTGWGTLFSNDGYHTYVYGQYTTRIVGHILFHSVPYFWQRKDALEWTGTLDNLNHEFNKLGTAASMGCIRLCVADVKWIYDNCPLGVTVVIYDERDNYGPLGRPENFIIDPKSEMLADIDPAILSASGYYKNTYKTDPNATINPLNWDPTDPDPNNPWIPILEAWEKKQQEAAEKDNTASGETGDKKEKK